MWSDGAKTQFAFCLAQAVGRQELPDRAAPVPLTEQLLFRVAEQAQAVREEPRIQGLLPYPQVLVFLWSAPGSAGAQQQLEEAALQEENSSFLPLSGYVHALS